MTKKAIACSILVAVVAMLSAVANADRPGMMRTTQVVDVVNLADGTPTGAAWIKRSNNAIEGRFMSDVGMAGVPITIWWLVWEDPSTCENPFYNADGSLAGNCNPGAGDEPSAVINASGAISASDGNGSGVVNIQMHLIAGEMAGGDLQPCCGGMLPPGMGKRAEIHMVAEKHPLPEDADSTWSQELTVPRGPDYAIRGVAFLPVK